jgi:peptidyl-prolyl cis-trans isomerase SurA
MKKELQGKVNRDERAKKTQDSFVSKLKTQYNYQDVSSKNGKWFIKNLDTTYFIGKWTSSKLKSDKPLFMLDGKAFGQKQFAEYLMKNYRNVKKDINENVVKVQLKNWEKEAVLAYEESQLTKKYPEYKALLNEYHDGILLYEIMTDKVWNKAIKDTVGLKSYFENNRDNYKWGNRTDAVIYECLNQPIADQVSKMLKNDTINSKHVLEVVNKESELNLRVKTNKFDNETTPFIQGRILKQGLNPSFELDGKVYVIKVNELLSPRNKEFNEAKGVITSDYQNYLEKKWLDELNKKYKITINESVLYSIGK